jgi:DNA-binding beta-propeller fold protein YncE
MAISTHLRLQQTGAHTGNAAVFVIRPNGKLVRQVAIANSSPHMLGLRFNPVNGFLLVLDFGAGTVLHVDPATGASSLFMTPTIAGAGLNALTFDKLGNVYVSDSFNGIIWKTGPNGADHLEQQPVARAGNRPDAGVRGGRRAAHQLTVFAR